MGIGLTALAALTGLAPALPEMSSGADPAVLADVDVFAEFPRYLQVAGEEVEIAFDNHGDTDLWVADVSVDADGFASRPATSRPALVRAGTRVDVKAPFGDVDCAASPERVEVTVRVAVGADADPVVADPLTVSIEPGPFTDIHADRCGAQAVAETVDLAWGQVVAVDDLAVESTLEIASLDGEPASVDATRGSVLFTVTPIDTASPLVTVDATAPAARVPVTIELQRCDPHAVIESKKTYQFAVWVTTGDLVSQHVVVEPGGELRAELEGLLERCLAENHPTPED